MYAGMDTTSEVEAERVRLWFTVGFSVCWKVPAPDPSALQVAAGHCNPIQSNPITISPTGGCRSLTLQSNLIKQRGYNKYDAGSENHSPIDYGNGDTLVPGTANSLLYRIGKKRTQEVSKTSGTDRWIRWAICNFYTLMCLCLLLLVPTRLAFSSCVSALFLLGLFWGLPRSHRLSSHSRLNAFVIQTKLN